MISKANKKEDKEQPLKVENCEKSERKKWSSLQSLREAKKNNEIEDEDKAKIDKDRS